MKKLLIKIYLKILKVLKMIKTNQRYNKLLITKMFLRILLLKKKEKDKKYKIQNKQEVKAKSLLKSLSIKTNQMIITQLLIIRSKSPTKQSNKKILQITNQTSHRQLKII